MNVNNCKKGDHHHLTWWENVSKLGRAGSGTHEMTVLVSHAQMGWFLCRL